MHEFKKERIRYIDYMKAIGMILVILGHINFANQGIKAWIYSFHMPLFFFVSGLVLKTDGAASFRSIISKIWIFFQRLMFPYFLWAMIYASFSFSNLYKIIYGSYWSIVYGGALSSLWFLPVMFVALVFVFIIQSFFKSNFTLPIKMLLVAFSFIISRFIPNIKMGYPWSFNVAIVAFGIMLFGNAISPYINSFNDFMNKNKYKFILCSVAAVVSWGATFIYRVNIPENGYTLMAGAKYGNLLLFACTSLCGIVMVLAISWLLDFCLQKDDFADFLSFVGKNTLCFFAIQKPVISCFRKVFQIVHLPNWLVLLFVLTGTLVLCSLLCLFINRYLPQFAGNVNSNS